MKKLLTILLAALLTLSLAACSDPVSSEEPNKTPDSISDISDISDVSSEDTSSDTSSQLEPLVEPEIVKPDKTLNLSEINAAWGMTEEQALEAFGFLPEYITERTDNSQSAVIHLEDIMLGEHPVSLNLYFTGYGEIPYLEYLQIFSPDIPDLKQLAEDFRKMDCYNQAVGFYDKTVFTAEELEWLRQNSVYEAGEVGFRIKELKYVGKGKSVWTGDYESENELPPITYSDYSDKNVIFVYGTPQHLLAQREAVEQRIRQYGIVFDTPME